MNAQPDASIRIPTSLGPLAVVTRGDGPTAVFLWHSLFLDARSWDPVVPALLPGRRLVLVDGPGHGASPGPAADYTLDDCAGVALAVLDHLGIERADWIGNAWGGHVGVVAALRAPRRIRSLAVLSSPMQALGAGERLRVGALAALLRWTGWRPRLLRLLADGLLAPAARARRPELDRYVEDAVQAQGVDAMRRAIRSISLHRPSLVQRLDRLAVPTLFVSTDDDPLWSPDVARAQMSRIAGARLEIIRGSRHVPQMEQPETVAALLVAWLAAARA